MTYFIIYLSICAIAYNVSYVISYYYYQCPQLRQYRKNLRQQRKKCRLLAKIEKLNAQLENCTSEKKGIII